MDPLLRARVEPRRRDTPRNLRERIEVYAAIVAGGPVTVTEPKPEAAAPPPPITR